VGSRKRICRRGGAPLTERITPLMGLGNERCLLGEGGGHLRKCRPRRKKVGATRKVAGQMNAKRARKEVAEIDITGNGRAGQSRREL